MKNQNKKNLTIGIWGVGVVGKAALKHLSREQTNLLVTDQKTLSESELELLKSTDATFMPDLSEFLEKCDFVVPSPGIDLRPYSSFQSKWLSELDIFGAYWHKPIIAITGSVGKTTIAHLIAHNLELAGKRVALGGNIGIAMFDLLPLQDQKDIAVLEVSSFQLELCKTFAPTVALWTTFFPNHLDRHDTITQYFNAKCAIFAHQTSGHTLIAPWGLREKIKAAGFPLNGSTAWISEKKLSSDQVKQLNLNEQNYYSDQNKLCFEKEKEKNISITIPLSEATYAQNLIFVAAALHTMGIENFSVSTDIAPQSHRLELAADKNGVRFYNDSKATIPEATLAAVNKLSADPLHLFLGGLSKGVDRSSLIKELKGKVKHIYCFGKEAEQLKKWCDSNVIPASEFATLETAFEECYTEIKKGDIVLFSPAGSSFDLFDNYQARGDYFKKLVQKKIGCN